MARAASSARSTTDQLLQIVSMEINTNTYSKELKFNVSDTAGKRMHSKKLFAWNCEGCSIAPLTNYANNWIGWLKKLPKKIDYCTIADNRIYLDL